MTSYALVFVLSSFSTSYRTSLVLLVVSSPPPPSAIPLSPFNRRILIAVILANRILATVNGGPDGKMHHPVRPTLIELPGKLHARPRVAYARGKL